MKHVFQVVCLALLVAAIALATVGPVQASGGPAMRIVATGLHNPRGLKFGPDGQLYVAEGGLGGSLSTVGLCPQVPAVGPYTGGFTSRISRIDVATGRRQTVVDGLPSSQTNPQLGSFVSGVADVAFIGERLYAVEAGAGCSHGLADTSNTVFRVNADGTTTRIANLSAFLKSHPVAHPNPDDFEPDGTWYSMVAHEGRLYAVEPNHGEVDTIDPRTGAVSRLVDVSASQGHIVPTALTFARGAFYLGNLNVFDPESPGHAGVFRLTREGDLQLVASGLTAVLGVAVHQEQIYALEAFTGFFAPAPFVANTGTVVRLSRSGVWQSVASGLNFPTAMTFGPDGKLYISNNGFGPLANTSGEVVRIELGS